MWNRRAFMGVRIALALLSLFWAAFALLSGAEQAGGGFIGIVRNSPNALPWLLPLALVWVTGRWPVAGGLAYAAIGAITISWFDTWQHPLVFLTISFPFLALGIAAAWLGHRIRR